MHHWRPPLCCSVLARQVYLNRVSSRPLKDCTLPTTPPDLSAACLSSGSLLSCVNRQALWWRSCTVQARISGSRRGRALEVSHFPQRCRALISHVAHMSCPKSCLHGSFATTGYRPSGPLRACCALCGVLRLSARVFCVALCLQSQSTHPPMLVPCRW